ncbi:MAG: hypothetical protein KF838_09495 [Phycisphaeraceae bacterium]|nr:MAG: hypothetical protein KF838_09495 [Phycisphaeraceae bacterium]
MSQKWRRSQQWDKEHFPGWAQPVRWLLHAFSTITLAVCLLVFVVIYAILASVPIGLLAQIPTYLIYALTLLLTIAGISLFTLFLPRLLLRRAGIPRAARFAIGVVGIIASIVLGSWLWVVAAWPALHYDPVTGRGLMLFADFVRQYNSTTLRRLPGVEMSELEFYSWWPLRVVLLAFVANMVTATVRRIEFKFENIGVLTVHTGIVVIALGSVYYTGLKKEGDTILFAGNPTPGGDTTIGPPAAVFYDNTRVALFIDQFKGWEQRPLSGIPRYNDYALTPDHPRTLSRSVMPSRTSLVDADIKLRVVGYASYADIGSEPVKASERDADLAAAQGRDRPVRFVDLLSWIPDSRGRVPEGPVHRYRFEPRSPAARASTENMLSVEYTMGMPEARWRDLAEPLPVGVRNALAIEFPGTDQRFVLPVARGQKLEVGQTGYTIEVEDLAPEPPFPIITKGFEGATSSVAIVRVTSPAGEWFTRWIYSRFPEINQDMLDTVNAQGMPARRDADPSIRIGYIDANLLAVNLDERPDGSTRAIVRLPSGEVRVTESVGATLDLVPDRIALTVTERWRHITTIERPIPVPSINQDKRFVGTHDRAALAVEITVDLGPTAPDRSWSTVVWLPFIKYLEIADDLVRTVALPDGRTLRLGFGRLRHPLPGFDIRLVDFQMIAYDHRGAPRDYQSSVLVSPAMTGPRTTPFEAYTHITKLNAPLTAPHRWDESRSPIANTLSRLVSGLSPNQYKFSQAGWDAEMWKQTQQMADAGQIQRPYVRYTILGVGNNPGIHVIALGSILMGLGIPWAFYVKPLIVQRKKKRIQQQIKDGTYIAPSRKARATSAAEPVVVSLMPEEVKP